MQELNYLNALGTINAAQVQAMQSMGMMGGQMGGQMGQMGATGFAQIATELGEDETVEGHDLFLSQLAHSLVSLSEA